VCPVSTWRSGWQCSARPSLPQPPIVARLNAEISKLLAQPAMRDRLTASGFAPSTPAELATRIREGIERWRRLAAELKLELN